MPIFNKTVQKTIMYVYKHNLSLNTTIETRSQTDNKIIIIKLNSNTGWVIIKL